MSTTLKCQVESQLFQASDPASAVEAGRQVIAAQILGSCHYVGDLNRVAGS